MNTTTNTPTTSHAIAKQLVAASAPIVLAQLKSSFNSTIVEASTSGEYKLLVTWAKMSDKQQSKHTSVYHFVGAKRGMEFTEEGAFANKSSAEYIAFAKAFKAGVAMQAKTAITMFASDDKLFLAECSSRLSQLIEAYAVKGASLDRRALVTTPRHEYILQVLVEAGLMYKSNVAQSTGEVTYSLGAQAISILKANGNAVRTRIIRTHIRKAVLPVSKPAVAIGFAGKRALDVRASMFSAEGTVAEAAINKLQSTPLELHKSFFEDNNLTAVTKEVTAIFNEHRESSAAKLKAAITGGDLSYLSKTYTEEIALAIKSLKGRTFYQSLKADLGGRMYNTSIVSMNLKSVRAYVQSADAYEFNTAAKVAAVAKLHANIVDAGNIKQHLTLEQIAKNLPAMIKRVTVTYIASATACPLSKRLIESLVNGHTMVKHIVGLDVTNQGSQNVSVMTHDKRLFDYTGVNLSNTAYNKLAAEFKARLIMQIGSKDEDMLCELITGKTFKYRFMTVFYNKAAGSQAVGSEYTAYANYVTLTEEFNMEKLKSGKKDSMVGIYVQDDLVKEGKHTGMPKYKLTSIYITMMIEMRTGVDAQGRYTTSDMDLPVVDMLRRNKIDLGQTSSEDITQIFIDAVNAVSPVAYKFAATYKANLYGFSALQARAIEYTSVDGYNVVVTKEEHFTQTLEIPTLKGAFVKFDVRRVANATTNKSQLGGSPRYNVATDSKQARSAALNANAVATIHDEYFFRLCDVAAGIQNHTEELVELFHSTHPTDHCVSVNSLRHEVTDLQTIGDGALTEADIRSAKFCLWF